MDPIFGDDEQAWALNPGNPSDNGSINPSLALPYPNGAQRARPLDSRTDFLNAAIIDPTTITGFLQHAPYPFKTLGGMQGANEYVQTLFSVLSGGIHQTTLPWVHPSGRTVTDVVIHCLPGLYGPKRAFAPDVDALSGLPWNGDTFPIRLGTRLDIAKCPAVDRISIQGTSALDTIFDARGNEVEFAQNCQNAPVFTVHGRKAFALPPCVYTGADHARAFIDGLTIRGSRAAAQACGASPTAEGCGICLSGHESSIRITITNCVFDRNTIGIALDANENQPPGVSLQSGQHEPLIINNTFVGNTVGIWAGLLTPGPFPPPPTPAYVNNHDPTVLNNVFLPADGLASSCFEGIQTSSLAVAQAGPMTFNPPADFNAWDPLRTRLGLTPANPATAQINLPASAPPLPLPRVDIAQFAHLLVRDLLLSQTATPLSPHDVRLSPFVSRDPNTAPGNESPLVPNPLIDSGVSTLPITLASSQGGIAKVVTAPPGLPAGAEEVSVHGWDNDMEGFGNDRIVLRFGSLTEIDLGADECGDLIMTGYVPSTRMFTADLGSQIFFVNSPNQTFFRPFANFVIGLLPWYDNVFQLPAPLPCQNNVVSSFTCGAFDPVLGPSPRFVANMAMNSGFPRNLECDFSASLLADLHPAWAGLSGSILTLTVPDPFAANPWYQGEFPATSFLVVPDNPTLFYNATAAVSAHGTNTYAVLSGSRTRVTSSHLNPPGTTLLPPGLVRFITGSGLFGPFAPCTGAPLYQTGVLCLNSLPTGCPDQVPDLGLQVGLRVNCEVPFGLNTSVVPTGRNSNLQTFLVIPGSVLAAMSRVSPPPEPLRLRLTTRLAIPVQFGGEAEFADLIRWTLPNREIRR